MAPDTEQYRHTAIGIDPGLASTGYAIIGTFARGGQLCDWGTLKTFPRQPVEQRLKIRFTGAEQLIEKWHPQLIVIEDVYVLDKFPKAAIQLGEVRGVLYLAAHNAGVEVMKLRPTEIKSGLTGNGRAGKSQVSQAVKRLLGIQEDIKPDHASDAAALALMGLSRSGRYKW